MHKIVMWLGGVTAALGAVAIIGGLVIGAPRHDITPAMGAAMFGLPAILSGALLYTFGSIVEHLIAIRKNTERQVEIFDKLGKPKA